MSPVDQLALRVPLLYGVLVVPAFAIVAAWYRGRPPHDILRHR